MQRKALWTRAFPRPETAKPRSRIIRTKRPSPISAKRKMEAIRYRALRTSFLAEHPRCAVFPDRSSAEIHHTRGRSGGLFLETRFWIAVSQAGHRWIDRNREEARELGLLCRLGDWGRQD